jgi:maltose phosphorylase
MKEGFLSRSFIASMPEGPKIKVESIRFLSMANPEIGAIKYSVTPINENIELTFTPYIDGDVKNEDSNYNEKFWNILETESDAGESLLIAQTKKLEFHAAYRMKYNLALNGQPFQVSPDVIKDNKLVGNKIKFKVEKGQTATIYKYGSVVTSLNYPVETLKHRSEEVLDIACKTGFETLFDEHKTKWAEIWDHCDIIIKGDIEAQQGIRFNIFHLNQTYTGEDERLNIGPKGFTGEKYGGSTYWDTEAYCIPFFISTAPSKVTRNLLLYRYKHLQKAIENAQKLGFKNGAALYPMVTMNGEECHNEWEITFEEIHRNGAIAFAIYNYIRHTGDEKYLAEYGLEVLIGIARFWSQRVNFSKEKNKYVILGVTGPNEYENNINNNWYTNTLAKWCLEYTIETIEKIKANYKQQFDEIAIRTYFNETPETTFWKDIIDNLYFAFDEKLNIFLQQDGYLDKDLMPANKLSPKERPINQHWSWDRILRSCFIKQADTLQGIYLFEERFDTEFIKRHFEFYESRTVHESSLSPCVHSILATRIGNIEKAYELYLRTSRLDLDDYNNEVHEGLHITSMAGTWMSIVEGFGGKRIKNGKLELHPLIHNKWKEYSFSILFRENSLHISVNKEFVNINFNGTNPLNIFVYNENVTLIPGQQTRIMTRNTF